MARVRTDCIRKPAKPGDRSYKPPGGIPYKVTDDQDSWGLLAQRNSLDPVGADPVQLSKTRRRTFRWPLAGELVPSGNNVPELSSLSRVRFAAFAAQETRALDRSGPFRRFADDKVKLANANLSPSAALCGLALAGPELHDNFGLDKPS